MAYILDGLYIGSADDAYNTVKLKEKLGITHILTVDCKPITIEAQADFTYKYIHALDMYGVDLLGHFEESNSFIDHGRQQGGVLVHCYAGVSRSGTLVLAYLMHHMGMSLDEALSLAKKQRRQICPNPSFQEQLKLYDSMGGTADPSSRDYKAYKLRLVAQSVQRGQMELPENSLIADPSQSVTSGDALYKCRKCRRPLFRKLGVTPHEVGSGEDAFSRPWLNSKKSGDDVTECTQSLFVEPLEWMRRQISELEGKLSCPKCAAKLGSYNWSGERCPCGTWITPAFHIASAKVDECKPRVLPPSVTPRILIDRSSQDT